ncbi:rRNA-processing protein UTP23 homolog [Anolis carolinensis]|uniref:rRNA-processing protein UTP23 homolog n=1 Tax=Anolis carolinensis TaxID=28377 RepID=A0A803TDQ7_ANOCA|nr:PREDICTED: rRNA-processing protein UTP23 homolog [Anolis carolinensis]|eukprot:XP_003219510.1 PREDICTED: rRNA-processing protein UTP23 homolog [Anolis carolinensis]
MKITRQKHAKRNMGFYKYNFGFREPFQVLLDGTFCQAALRNKIQIREQLPGYLGGATQLCTTRCVLKELESLGKELYGAKLIAQRFQVRHCSHFKSPVSGSTCLLSMTEGDNPHHYFTATQDQTLATKIKKRAGIPLLFIIQNTIVLDKPSAASLASVQAMQTNKLIPEHQKESISRLKEEQGLVKPLEAKKRKRKRIAGPNPLSCLKKKKKKGQEATQPTTTKKKVNRKRNKRKPETTAGIVQPGSQNAEA